MTTRNLLGWIGLFGGAEAMLRGHLAALPWLFVLGAGVLMAGLAFAAWRARSLRAASAALGVLAIAPGVFAALETGGVFEAPAPAPDPLVTLWETRSRERQVLDDGTPNVEVDRVHLFGHPIVLDPGGWRAYTAKRGSFRIVAVGGATTFGATRTPDEPTWPSALGDMIGSELRCRIPVEIVNAGVPGRSIQDTLKHLDADLARLTPDLLVYLPNAEDLVGMVRAVPELALPRREPVPARASQLMRRWEIRRRAREAERSFSAAARTDHSEKDLRKTPIGKAYRKLLVDARKRGVDVVLLPIALAVDKDSDEATLYRFEALEPRARRFALARPLHERLLRQVAANYRTQVLDTTPNLDGAGDEAFLHLATFSPEGRRRLARNVFDGLRKILAKQPTPGCTPREAVGVESPPPRES